MGKKRSFVRQKILKPNCNKCGDYEYCAFEYDKCTGFIPGGDYGNGYSDVE